MHNGGQEYKHDRLHPLHCIASNLRRLVVFTNTTRDLVAIEPVSHVNNAINLVQAGESMSAQMSILVERAA